MRKGMAYFIALLMLLGIVSSAMADKARGISTDSQEAFHVEHLHNHLNDMSCCTTGNYIKVRESADSNARVLGHLEQADEFVLMALSGSFAYIRVTNSHETSPDSWDGLEGWVTAAYIDCCCSDAAYHDEKMVVLTGGFFPVGMPTCWSFCSGAGGWSTEIAIAEDGSFTGYYHDWDGGSADLYPRGTLQECSFSGRFSVAERISDYEYRVVVDYVTQEGNPGDQFVRDEQLVTITYPYGISLADSFIIYLPGTPLNRIPQAYFEWADMENDGYSITAFAFYNMTDAFGWNEQE